MPRGEAWRNLASGDIWAWRGLRLWMAGSVAEASWNCVQIYWIQSVKGEMAAHPVLLLENSRCGAWQYSQSMGLPKTQDTLSDFTSLLPICEGLDLLPGFKPGPALRGSAPDLPEPQSSHL